MGRTSGSIQVVSRSSWLRRWSRWHTRVGYRSSGSVEGCLGLKTGMQIQGSAPKPATRVPFSGLVPALGL